jgi:hypothetical protein
LTPDVALKICAAITEGCYQTVAAARVGVIPYTVYLWNERGKREALGRAEAQAQGKPADGPMSCYEEFHLMLESAKASARYSAETRVFRTNPLAWLKSGYARRDWRESDVTVRVGDDEVAKQVAALLGVSDAASFPMASVGAVSAVMGKRLSPYGLAGTPDAGAEEGGDTESDSDE